VTPFIFFLEKNKSYQFKKNSTYNNSNNVSEIERMRGNMSDSATPSLMQFPSGFKIEARLLINQFKYIIKYINI